MTQVVGGKRIRLIHDNLFNLVFDACTELGWLEPSPSRADVTVRKTQISAHEEAVKPNIVCVTIEDDTEQQEEMGSGLTEHRWNAYVDVYAQNDVLGLHLATDMKDSLMGRFDSTVTRGGPSMAVYDLTQSHATPVELFYVQFENIAENRSRFSDKPYQDHWRVVDFHIVDVYDSESGS